MNRHEHGPEFATPEDVAACEEDLRIFGEYFTTNGKRIAPERLTRPPWRTCLVCGCTEDKACLHPNGEPCAWVESGADLCTACADKISNFELVHLPNLESACGGPLPVELAQLLAKSYVAGWNDAEGLGLANRPPTLLLPGRDF